MGYSLVRTQDLERLMADRRDVFEATHDAAIANQLLRTALRTQGEALTEAERELMSERADVAANLEGEAERRASAFGGEVPQAAAPIPITSIKPLPDADGVIGHLVTVDWEGIDPLQHPPPRGVEMICVNEGGRAIMAQWQDGFLCYAPKFTVPRSVREREAARLAEVSLAESARLAQWHADNEEKPPTP